MTERIICNAVALYKEAPVSGDLLKEKTSALLEAIQTKNAQKNYLILDHDEKTIEHVLKVKAEKCGDMNLEIIGSDGSVGFAYANHSALEKVVQGEKPLPSSKDTGEGVFTVEELLGLDEKVVYILGSVQKKGRHRFNKSVTPGEILKASGVNGKYKGMYLGYPMGLFVPEEDVDRELCLTTDVVTVFDETDCILAALHSIAQGYQKESCGRCVFGYEGVTQINMILSDMVQKKGRSEDLALLQDLCGMMRSQTLCEVDAILAQTLMSALEHFKQEIEGHVTKKTCKAGACSKFVTYHILSDKCTGCNECQDECGDDAILGKKRFIHVIDQDECTQCGACVKACDEGAIVKAGAIKPKCPTKPMPYKG